MDRLAIFKCKITSFTFFILSGIAPRAVYVLGSCLFLGQALLHAEVDHNNLPTDPGGLQRPSGQFSSNQASCSVDPSGLAEFAQGTKFDYGNLVAYLSTPSCEKKAFGLSRQAVSDGVSFSQAPELRLDYYSKPLLENDLEGWQKNASELAMKSSEMLRRLNYVGTRELLPIAGQFALLSPDAGRKTLVKLVEQNLLQASTRMESNPSEASSIAGQTATSLKRLGAHRMVIANELGAQMEEMAILAQADSLGRVLTALGSVAREDSAFVPTFNISAGALSVGVQKSAGVYKNKESAEMIQVVFNTMKTAGNGGENFAPALESMNLALLPLLQGKPLTQSELKKGWAEALKLLSETPTQPVLAEAVALSLTPEFLFLPDNERAALSLASKNYNDISRSLQENYLKAYSAIDAKYASQKISDQRMQYLRKRFLRPWTEAIMRAESGDLEYPWLKSVVQAEFIPPKVIEKKFPLLLLTKLKASPQALQRGLASGGDPASIPIESMSHQFTTLWYLSHSYLPALEQWVMDYNGENTSQKEKMDRGYQTEPF